MLVNVPECLKNDFRLSREQSTPRFLVLFEGVGENVFLFLKFVMFQIHFAQLWRNFLGCSRDVGIFSRVKVGCA